MTAGQYDNILWSPPEEDPLEHELYQLERKLDDMGALAESMFDALDALGKADGFVKEARRLGVI